MKICNTLFLLLVLINQIICQQIDNYDIASVDTIDQSSDVVFIYDMKVDTIGLNILYVLEMERIDTSLKQTKTCGTNDFAILYDNFSGVYYEMGCAWAYYKIHWIERNDSILFYSWSVNKQIKQNGLTQKNQVKNFIIDNGIRRHIGSGQYDFSTLIRDSQNYYSAYSDSTLINSYRFKKEDYIKDCFQSYYFKSIKSQ